MAKSGTPEVVSTTMKLDKSCKSCKRYRSTDPADPVGTSFYLGNASWEKLGSPNEITISVAAAN